VFKETVLCLTNSYIDMKSRKGTNPYIKITLVFPYFKHIQIAAIRRNHLKLANDHKPSGVTGRLFQHRIRYNTITGKYLRAPMRE